MAEQEKKVESKEEKLSEQKKEEAKEAEKEEHLLQMSELGVWIDNYDDIFSDFDPRPYSQRALSDDFLREAKKASLDKPSGIELKFLVQKEARKPSQEPLIRKRLHEHFKKHSLEIKKDIHDIITQGVLLVIFGIFIMFVATFISLRFHEEQLLPSFLIVILEPAGWFLFWEGFHNMFFESKSRNSDLKFYEKMAKCEISFIDY